MENERSAKISNDLKNMRRRGKPAFISGPILMVLMLCLITSLSLGEALGHAGSGTRHKMDSLKAYLAFEETILRVDLDLPVRSFQQGEFEVIAEELMIAEGMTGIRLRLMDGTSIVEEAWLEEGA